MRHLVVGGTGQVGQALTAVLRTRGADVVMSGYTRAADLSLDLADRTALRAALDAVAPAVVWLVGAFTHVDGCETDPTRSRRINAEAPAEAAAWATRHGARLVFLSTDYVFDGRHGPYRETDTPRPLSQYGRDKLEAEGQVLACPGGLVARTAWVYSWADPRNFARRLAGALAAGEQPTVPDDQWGNPTYAPDLARAVVALWEIGAQGLYHVAGPTVWSRAAFARLIAERLGYDPGRVHAVPSASLGQIAPRPLHAGLYVERLAAALGWVPRPPQDVWPHLAALSRAAQRPTPAEATAATDR